MLNIKVKLKNSIDIYTYPNENPNLINMQFYKINTREKKTIEVNSFFQEIIPLLDGNYYVSDIYSCAFIKRVLLKVIPSWGYVITHLSTISIYHPILFLLFHYITRDKSRLYKGWVRIDAHKQEKTPNWTSLQCVCMYVFACHICVYVRSP